MSQQPDKCIIHVLFNRMQTGGIYLPRRTGQLANIDSMLPRIYVLLQTCPFFLHHCEKLLKARCTFVRNMTNSAFRSTSFLSLCAGLKKEKMALFSIAHRPRSHLPLFLCSETKQEPLRPFYLFTVWQLKIDEKNPGESGSPPLSLSQKQNRAMKGQSLHNRCSIKDRTLMKRRPTEEAYGTPRASYSI